MWKNLKEWIIYGNNFFFQVFYPTSRNPINDQDTTALLDFDSEEEFNAFFFKTRTDLLEIFRKATDVSNIKYKVNLF